MQPSSWRLLVPPFPSATFLKAIPPPVPASRGLLPWGTASSPIMPVSPSSNTRVARPTPTHGMSSQGRGLRSSQHILSSAPASVCVVTAPRGPWQPDTPPPRGLAIALCPGNSFLSYLLEHNTVWGPLSACPAQDPSQAPPRDGSVGLVRELISSLAQPIGLGLDLTLNVPIPLWASVSSSAPLGTRGPALTSGALGMCCPRGPRPRLPPRSVSSVSPSSLPCPQVCPDGGPTQTYPIVGMCSVVKKLSQGDVLRVTWGVHPHRGACRHVVENEPKSSFLVGGEGEAPDSAPSSFRSGGPNGPNSGPASSTLPPQVPTPKHSSGSSEKSEANAFWGRTLTTETLHRSYSVGHGLRTAGYQRHRLLLTRNRRIS